MLFLVVSIAVLAVCYVRVVIVRSLPLAMVQHATIHSSFELAFIVVCGLQVDISEVTDGVLDQLSCGGSCKRQNEIFGQSTRDHLLWSNR